VNSSPDLTYRRLTPDDAHELAYLELEIFTAPWSESSLKSCLQLPNVEGDVAVLEQSIVGYVFAQYVVDEAHLLNIAVRKQYRRRGIGRKLLEKFLEVCNRRGSRLSYLEVRSGNRAAQKMYYDFGFMPLSVRKRYYPDGEDALILVKYFNTEE